MKVHIPQTERHPGQQTRNPDLLAVSKFSVVAMETEVFQRIADILGFVFVSGHSTESFYVEF